MSMPLAGEADQDRVVEGLVSTLQQSMISAAT